MNLQELNIVELRKLARSEYGINGKIESIPKADLIEIMEARNLTSQDQELDFEFVEVDSSGIPEEENNSPVTRENSLDSALANALRPYVNGSVNLDQVNSLIDSRLGESQAFVESEIESLKSSILSTIEESLKGRVQKIELKTPSGLKEITDKTHPQFERVLRKVNRGRNVLLVGETGTGKTHIAEQIAQALDLEYFPQSVGSQTTKSDLIGYTDVNGNYVPVGLYKAFKFGGLYLLDEFDSGNAGVATVLNAALSNGYMSFPHEVVPKHENFRCIAAANTFGKGANRKYVGRLKQDFAVLKRFAVIEMDYDKELELTLTENAESTYLLHDLRDKIAAHNLEMAVTTRDIVWIHEDLLDGDDLQDVMHEYIFQGAPIEQIVKVWTGKESINNLKVAI